MTGFTLVESMIALVVLSVGMIGVAALHGQGLSAGRSAQLRSIAINLSADMADRIRVNRLGGAAYAGAAANNNCDPVGGGGVDCTPAQMAAHDLWLWNQQVAAALPNGQANIAFNAGANPSSYSITLQWDEVGEPAPVQHQIVLQLPVF
jgi:type IV pilus assembly protein PilV